MRDLPAGTVTFLFTDIEGSTKLLGQLGAESYGAALAEHRRLIRDVFARHGGVEVDTQGDSFFIAFGDPAEAVAAADEAQRSLASAVVRVRMGLHTGTPHVTAEGYVGQDVHLGSRLAAAGHGGQVLLSKQTRDGVADAFELVDLGEHRLRDFDEPVWIYQLGTDGFAPLRTISNTNLPRPVSSFVGRANEVTDIGALLKDGARLVTLSGTGGSGKTRLAIECAIALVPEFDNGVFWVDLAQVHDPALVSETIARTLGAKDGLAQHINERHMLLVLDNLEQVIEAAPQLSSLLSACANLRLLVTSRELMRVNGEIEYAVPPLASLEAIELFVARSGLEPSDTIAEICRQLDDLPLAVELAAARTDVLSPAQILERLTYRLDLFRGGRDAQARQQTLRATIAWSHDLLTPEEQLLFMRLGVFVGGCTLEAAQGIAAADLDILQSLVNKSLIGHADERFTMLETIRQYASERLDESAKTTDLRRRHAQHFLALSEEAETSLFGPGPGEWLDRLELELGNLRAALDWLEASGETELVLRMAGALEALWTDRGHYAEGARRLQSALRADPRPTAARAKALNAVTDLTLWTGDHAAWKEWAEEALTLNRTLGDARGVANAAWAVGFMVSEEGGDFQRAVELLEESVRILRRLGDVHNTLGAVRTLAHAYREMGDRDRARALIEDNLVEARALGDTQILSVYLGDLGMYAVRDGRFDDATELLTEGSRLALEFGGQYEVIVGLCRFANLLALVEKPAAAARVLSSADALREQFGAAFEPWNTRLNEQTLAVIHAKLRDDAVAAAWEEGGRLKADEAVELALAELEAS
jgi:predicted ATPase/class 3 adenylate cyclase